MRTAGRQLHGGGSFAAGPGQIVRDHPAPPDVLRANPVALPELQDDQRRADFFARVQPKWVNSWPATHAQLARGVAIELGGPLARPADDGDHPFLGHLEVEVRQVAIGRSPAGRRNAFRLAGSSSVSSGA